MGTFKGCLDKCLFVSIMSLGTHWEILTIVYLSPLCHGYSLGVSCPLSYFLHYVMGTHWEYLDNFLFVSIMSWVLIRSVLTIVKFSPLCHRYSLGVSLQLSNCLHYAIGTHLECLDNCLYVSIMSWVLIGSVLTIVDVSPLCHWYSLGVS